MKSYIISLISMEKDIIVITAKNKKEARRKARRKMLHNDYYSEMEIGDIREVEE